MISFFVQQRMIEKHITFLASTTINQQINSSFSLIKEE